MNQRTKALLAGGLALMVVAPAALAAPAKSKAKPAPKPAAKKPAPRVVQGTKQLSGDQAEPNLTYTVGKESPINFTLKSAEYSVARIGFGDDVICPKKDEKLLILHYILHNPQHEEVSINWDSLHFTVVDDKNVNHEYTQYVGDEKLRNKMDMRLKPAQKVDAYTAIRVPANASTPKLMVLPTDGSPVLRYDMRGKIQGLTAPICDPNDKNGAIALEEVPAQLNTYYPLGVADLKVEGAAYSTSPILKDQEISEDCRLLVVTFGVKNMTPVPQDFDWGSFTPALTTSADEDIEWNQWTILGAANRAANNYTLKPGQETKLRWYFEVPNDSTAKTLTVYETVENSRLYSFDLSAIK